MIVDVHTCWSLEEIDGGSIFISALQRRRVATPGKLLYTKSERERERSINDLTKS
jgi:hypothetical protein